MFNDSISLESLKTSLNLSRSNLVSQVPVSSFFTYFPILDPIWSSYKQLCMSSLSDSLVHQMTEKIQRLVDIDPLVNILSSSLNSFPSHKEDLLRQYESNDLDLSSALKLFIQTPLSPFWQSSVACFKYINPLHLDSSGKPLSYPQYFHDPVILDAYNHSCLEVRGNFFYPPSGFREWHTNYRNPGLRAYCVFCDEAFSSSFNYLDLRDNSTVIVQDKSDFCNVFEVPEPSDLASYLWHSVSSQTWRISMGFRVVEQISDLDLLRNYIYQRPYISSPFNWNTEWEWWIRLPLWNTKSELSQFLRFLRHNNKSLATSFLQDLITRFVSSHPVDKDKAYQLLDCDLSRLISKI